MQSQHDEKLITIRAKRKSKPDGEPPNNDKPRGQHKIAEMQTAGKYTEYLGAGRRTRARYRPSCGADAFEHPASHLKNSRSERRRTARPRGATLAQTAYVPSM